MSNDKNNEAPETRDTGYRPGDDSWTRWRNTFALLSGNLSPEGVRQYQKKRDDRYEEEDCRRCEKFRDHLLSRSTSHASRDMRSAVEYTKH